MLSAWRIGTLAMLLLAVLLLCGSGSGSNSGGSGGGGGDGVNGDGEAGVGVGDRIAWHRLALQQQPQTHFNRYARHSGYYNHVGGGGGGSGGGVGGGVIGGGGGVINNLDEFNGLYALANGANQQQLQQQQQQQQPVEVYGIVEPLIEDQPCVDRPCNANDDCCPAGVCVNTYGEGKCIYVYGRKRDLCHRNLDCDAGSACLRAVGGNLMCQPLPPATLRAMQQQQLQHQQLQQQQQQQQQMQLQQQQQQLNNALNMLTSSGAGGSGGGGSGSGIGLGLGLGLGGGSSSSNLFGYRQFGDECESSRDCAVAKGMCCQLQRGSGAGGGIGGSSVGGGGQQFMQQLHHQSSSSSSSTLPQRERAGLVMAKRVCAYFHDPFMCIDIMPTENEELREARLLSAFRKRRL